MNFIKLFFRKYFVEVSPVKRVVSILVFLFIFVVAGIGIVYAITSMTVTDSYNDSTKIASAVNVTVDTVNGRIFLSTASAWSCGSTLLDTRDGKSYATVLIGSQCWMQQNLNIGTMITGTSNQGVSTTSIQKYCYANNEANCNTSGGLYQWDQAMGGSVTEGARGICPTGWHVPTHNEFTLLERTTCTSGTCAANFPYDSVTTGWLGTNEGTTLKNVAGLFRGLLVGYRETNGTFASTGTLGNFWSSLQSSANAWNRSLASGYATVYRTTLTKAYGFSLRCLKD
jgi:uncharacterized protein (TIGR02145 family)